MLTAFLADAKSTIKARTNRDETGATAVEYGIMVALIAVVIIVAVTLLGGNLQQMMGDASCQMDGDTTAATDTFDPALNGGAGGCA
ncbi:Flp family type IVb pilin [Arthrobacter sp.]|uniref:Flp family type IVb pilin n=1 Tax=Arthrobacter sp. TaxID=1667 RepID=UPI002811B2B3|nr:Flp family type IVb pilin [Arthrobacter sp.]